MMKTYHLTDEEFQVIARALGDVPLRIAGPIFGKMLQQKEAQDKPAEIPQDHADKQF